MGGYEPSVLLVEQDQSLREQMSDWLERSGFQVLMCPGPSAPIYTCVATQAGSCPLARGADLVLLDLWLASDSVMSGTSAPELLSYYLSLDRPVVVMDHGHDELRTFLDEVAAVLEFPPEPHELVETVRVLLQRGRRPDHQGHWSGDQGGFRPEPRQPPRRTLASGGEEGCSGRG